MANSMTTNPAAAQANCFTRKVDAEPKRSFAITAEALKTITNPTKTSSRVTVNSQRSTLTRFAIQCRSPQGNRSGRMISSITRVGLTGGNEEDARQSQE